MNVSEVLHKIDTFLDRPVMVSGYLIHWRFQLKEPWYVQPTKEGASFQDCIHIDLTNMLRQLDELEAGDKESFLEDRDMAFFLTALPVRAEYSPDPPKPEELGRIEIEGILAPPVDPRFAASLKDIRSIAALRSDHIYRYQRGIRFTDFLTAEGISVTDALNRRVELDQQQVNIRCVLSGWGRSIYVAPDRSSMSNMSSCVLISPAVYNALMYVLPLRSGVPYTYDYDAQVTGKLVNKSAEPFPATLEEITNVTLQRNPYCVVSWEPAPEGTSR